jgi:hypothetical protein
MNKIYSCFSDPSAVKGLWIWFWKCAIPVLSTGVVFQDDSWESCIQVPLSALPLLYYHQYRDYRYVLLSCFTRVGVIYRFIIVILALVIMKEN